MMDRQAFSKPIRVVAGPELAVTEYPAVFVLDPGAAAGSAAINAEIRGTFCSHGKLTRRFRSGSSQSPLVYI